MPSPTIPLCENIWYVKAPHTMMGLHLSSTMTVVRLPDGGLWVHSPVALNDELREAILALGPVRFIVAPNMYHHMYATAFQRSFPQAELWAPRGLEKKQPELRIDRYLEDASEASWAGTLRPVHVGGIPVLRETCFVHKSQQTLICADLLFHFTSPGSWLTKFYAQLTGCWQNSGLTIIIRSVIRDKPAVQRAIREILQDPIERVIIAHETPITEGGGAALARAWGVSEHAQLEVKSAG